MACISLRGFPMMRVRDLGSLVKAAAIRWFEDNCPRLGAAVAYYTVFSLAPLLILVIAIVGLTLGQRETAQEAVDLDDIVSGLDVQAGKESGRRVVESDRPVDGLFGVEDAVFGHHAALACHMANESYFRKAIVTWDDRTRTIKG